MDAKRNQVTFLTALRKYFKDRLSAQRKILKNAISKIKNFIKCDQKIKKSKKSKKSNKIEEKIKKSNKGQKK